MLGMYEVSLTLQAAPHRFLQFYLILHQLPWSVTYTTSCSTPIPTILPNIAPTAMLGMYEVSLTLPAAPHRFLQFYPILHQLPCWEWTNQLGSEIHQMVIGGKDELQRIYCITKFTYYSLLNLWVTCKLNQY